MSRAKIIGIPKVEMFSVSGGGDQGEETYGVFFSWEEAFECIWSHIKDSFRDGISKVVTSRDYRFERKFHEQMREYFRFNENDKDGSQKYMWYDSAELPSCLRDTLELSNDWWWMTRHLVSVPENVKIS